MIPHSPPWIARVARRLLTGTLFALISCVAVSADLSGYWTLDEKRSESWKFEGLLTAAARARVAEFDPKKHDPTQVCMPYGMPRVMSALGAFPFEIVQTNSQVTMIFDPHEEVRRVFLTKKFDPKQELAPLWLGYAYGKWEGSTLAVETVGITDQGLVDAAGVPHSEELRVVERIRRVDANTLLNEMTLHDPSAFTRPVTRKLVYARVPEHQQREFHCAEQQWLDHVMDRAKELTRELAGAKK
jgi:hypothetical protein